MTENRLSETTSPYLLQHADNPVQWHPWDEQALQLAKQANKPILLSIGYSACHWCHVMAHESFEDDATAALMNDLFINIKVDREERPDLDKIYQTAYQLMNKAGGGWPLTVFLTPDEHVPFFTGTYFPPVSAYGRPAFKEVLTAVSKAWQTREAEIRQQNNAILDAFSRSSSTTGSCVLTDAPIKKVTQLLETSFEPGRGGFSQAPKFPHPDMLNQCLVSWYDNTEPELKNSCIHMADITGRFMALGGVNDHVGGGFCRYSTDAEWMIPHFEKMLYDNGPLMGFYTDLFLITGNELYKQAVESTAQWTQREMQSSQGGYYSAQDADSEGVEGKFYVWKKDDIKQLLTADEYKLVARYFSLDRAANFEGHWHLHCDAQRYPEGMNAEQRLLWKSAREKLFNVRKQRVAPGTDDKILTAWNALMIKGMVKAGVVFGEDSWIDSAERSLKFILAALWKEGRLLAVHREGVSHLNAYLDDYAYLIDAVLELLSVRWNKGYLEFAIELADVLIDQFEDKQSGGFFFTSNQHESLIHRPKPFTDDAIPSGNGVAAKVLGRLGLLLGNTKYLQAAERTLQAAWSDMNTYPHAHCTLLQALQENLNPVQTIVIRGRKDEIQHWSQLLNRQYHPHRQVIAIPGSETDLPGGLAEKKAASQACAYICEGMTCLPPVMELDQLF